MDIHCVVYVHVVEEGTLNRYSCMWRGLTGQDFLFQLSRCPFIPDIWIYQHHTSILSDKQCL